MHPRSADPCEQMELPFQFCAICASQWECGRTHLVLLLSGEFVQFPQPGALQEARPVNEARRIAVAFPCEKHVPSKCKVRIVKGCNNLANSRIHRVKTHLKLSVAFPKKAKLENCLKRDLGRKIIFLCDKLAAQIALPTFAVQNVEFSKHRRTLGSSDIS